MKESKPLFRKKSSTKIVQKILFPIEVRHQQKRKTYEINTLYLKQHQLQKNVNYPYHSSQINTKHDQSLAKKDKKRIMRINSLTKLTNDVQIQLMDESDLIKKSKHQKNNQQVKTFKKVYFFQQSHHNNDKQNQSCESKITHSIKHRSLTKVRSVTKVRSLANKTQILNQSVQKLNPSLKHQKGRSLTKLQSQWNKGRIVQRQKERQKVHKFDMQKIGRAYDHLGKLKKSTLNKNKIRAQFPSLKNLSKQIGFIQKAQFEQTYKKMSKHFNPDKNIEEENDKKQKLQNVVYVDEQVNKAASPKKSKKNYLKVGQNYHHKKQGLNSKKQTNGFRHNIRASADETLFRHQTNNQNQDDLQNQVNNDSFFSDVDAIKMQIPKALLNKDNLLKQGAPLENNNQDFSSFDQNCISNAPISENQQTFIFDKVYFLSTKLSSGFASVFSIQRINFKSKPNQKFIIEIVIQAYEQIVVQKIVYNKSKRSQTFKKLKPFFDKEHQKQRLKNDLFSQLMVKRQIQKLRQSVPQELVLASQKQNFIRNSNQQSIRKTSNLNDCTNVDYLGGHTLGIINQKKFCGSSQNKSIVSSVNFSQVSPQCYQSIIQFIQKYCQLQISYLGASLRQSESGVPLMNQLMKKKHSQMQQTLLESLNLAKVFYFVIKINTTYYVAKSVIIANKKIKHFLLYQFSNLIRHSKSCIIEQQQQIPSKQNFSNFRKYDLVQYLYHKILMFFNSKSMSHFINPKHENQQLIHTNSNIPLLNALQLCFGTIKQIGLPCQIQIESERLYRVIQSNYRNDIRWQEIQYNLSSNFQHQNFFVFHSSFDYGLLNNIQFKNQISLQKPLFTSHYAECDSFKQPSKHVLLYSYTINRKFQIKITVFKGLSKIGRFTVKEIAKSMKFILKDEQKNIKQTYSDDKFRKQQFLLLHLIEDKKTCNILNAFLKKQYIYRLSRQMNMSYSLMYNCRPLFTMLKDKKYYVKVFAPFLQAQRSQAQRKLNKLKEAIYISIQSRISQKKFCLKITIQQMFSQMKQFYRLYSDRRTYQKYLQTSNNIKRQHNRISKQTLKQKIKLFINKLQLLKKNSYSHFYFIPVPDLISQASYKASSIQPANKKRQQRQWNSLLLNENEKSLILGALSKLQASVRDSQKISKAVTYPIRLKNFPTYQIYYKTIKKLIPGYYIIISIYYLPIFDLSEIKFYLSKVHKNFYICVKKDIKQSEYQNIISIFIDFLKDKFFNKVMVRQSQKLSHKYKQFYSKMIKQAQSPFITRTRKNKQAISIPGLQSSNRRNRHGKKNYTLNDVEFIQLTQQLLCKVFQSKRKNKYLIRLSYLPSQQYVEQQKRKGIDETISISIFKQNSMLIYKFQTTARKLLSKKITHKYNVIQLQYQQKNKPFYILFDQIKFLIQESDQSTYGLLNTFRSYFLNKHYNSLTTNNLVSLFSIGLLNGMSNNFLSSQNSIRGTAKGYYPFQAQRQLNIKEVHSNMYQRFCLFIQKNQIMEVLKIRSKYRNRQYEQSQPFIGSQSNWNKCKKENIPVIRNGKRKQSIEAYLPQHSIQKGSIRINSRKQYLQSSKSVKSIKNKMDSIKQSNSDNQMFESSGSNSKKYFQQQKIVYLIDKNSEIITQIQSSQEDKGFTINIPFGKYNKRMFKRFFKDFTLNAYSECQSNQSNQSSQQNNLSELTDSQDEIL